MPKFSQRSLDELATSHRDLQQLFKEVILRFDCTILEGRRSQERQNQLFQEGKSKTIFSKHITGRAVDVTPWPIDWNDTKRIYVFCGYVMGIAEKLGIHIRGGFDWDRDFTFIDQSFHDTPHFELLD